VVTVAGAGAGAATVTATGVGATVTTSFTVTPTAATFSIDQTTNATGPVVTADPTVVAMKIGDSLSVRVNAPAGITNVTFATTIGTWSVSGTAVQSVAVVAGKATAILNTTLAGVANIQVFDTAAPTVSSDTLTVTMTAATADRITLQATPNVLPKSVGGTVGAATLVATVRNGGTPVGDAPVAFEIINPTGGGETISPVIVLSAATTAGGLGLGEARATFTSGSLPSPAGGVKVRARVVGTTVVTEAIGTNVTNSGPDVAITIGGTAGSVAFGIATVLQEVSNATAYKQAMSVLVADANGSPVPGTVVSLSAWPAAWSTGGGCFPDRDFGVPYQPLDTTLPLAYPFVGGTFLNEDVNENLTLDSGEDGVRDFYYYPGFGLTAGQVENCGSPISGTGAAGIPAGCGPAPNPTPCTTDPDPYVYSTCTVPTPRTGGLTPTNSAAGIVVSTRTADAPGTATTDASGVATFDLVYGKTSALWVITRIRARTLVQGTETSGQIEFRLPGLESDITPICRLPASPYLF